MSYVYVEVDISDVEHELDRIIDGPGIADVAEFESVLASQFQITQQAVHIITGSLKLSGKISSRMDTNSWEGEITYGGVAAGALHNPVKYAHYEQERDGAHDYMEPIYRFDDRYGDAVEGWLKGAHI
jgi:hypothetical protein